MGDYTGYVVDSVCIHHSHGGVKVSTSVWYRSCGGARCWVGAQAHKKIAGFGIDLTFLHPVEQSTSTPASASASTMETGSKKRKSAQKVELLRGATLQTGDILRIEEGQVGTVQSLSFLKPLREKLSGPEKFFMPSSLFIRQEVVKTIRNLAEHWQDKRARK